jgi:glycerol kinase
LLLDLATGQWDKELLELFRIPASMLPEVRDNAARFGQSEVSAIGVSLPISGMAGDQQSAVIGQACFKPGMIKSTYGTGCFALLNTGSTAVASRNRLLTTIGYRLKGELAYAIEGSIFVAGAAVQWLRDGLKLIQQAGETEALARSIAGNNGVYLVPAFTGLGAPYWDPSARGALFGLTRDTGIAEVVRSALEAVCYQTRDLMEAMANDMGASEAGIGTNADLSSRMLRVDGGMVKNDWVMQFLADILNMPVERPVVSETTALGAAICAGLGAGLFASLDEVAATWQRDRLFQPAMPDVDREHLYKGWRAAVKRVQSSPT